MPEENPAQKPDGGMLGGINEALLNGTSGWFGGNPLVGAFVSITLVVFVAWLALFVIRRFLLGNLTRIVTRGQNVWRIAFERRQVLQRASLLVPVLILRAGLVFVPGLGDTVTTVAQRVLASLIVALAVRTIADLINAFGFVYSRTQKSKERPIKGYLQAVVLVLYLIAGVIIVATLIDRSPSLILGGLGAASAVLLLVFSDTILSLVASMQLTANDLIRVGDWIEMPQMNADGDVLEISLNTVKVQNWDKSFTVIPAHMFLNNSYRNWRGMQEAGGRRIKRSILLDMSSIKFLSDAEIENLKHFKVLSNYLSGKEEELEGYNKPFEDDPADLVNTRRLTNIGTFRAYVTRYLEANPMIHKDLTFIVRLLEPTSEGVPLEIYVFTTDIRWAYFERIQSDVFDHLMAILPEFYLRVYQSPSGADMRSLQDFRPAQTELTG